MLNTLIKRESYCTKLDSISFYSLLISLFFLPLNMWLNNFFTVLFIGTQLLSFLFNFKNRIKEIRKHLRFLVIVTSPFFITLLGLLYSNHISNGLDDVLRLLPIFFLPIFFASNKELARVDFLKSGFVFVTGCVLAALICWSYNLTILLNNNENLSELLSPIYANQGLTKILDIHASYMALLVNTAIAFLVYVLDVFKELKNKTLIRVCLFVLVLFLFHLLARTAIIVFLLSGLAYIILTRKWKALFFSIITFVVIIFSINSIDKNYLRDRLFNNLNFFEKSTQFSKKDDRFNRLRASYEVFLEHPIIGPGTADEDEFRKEIFKQNRDVVAYNENYNSHNQFFEYLSTFGIIGGIMYLAIIIQLLSVTIKYKMWFFLFIFTGFFLGSMTESLLERTLGITYFSLSICFLILTINNNLNSKK